MSTARGRTITFNTSFLQIDVTGYMTLIVIIIKQLNLIMTEMTLLNELASL